MMETSESGRSAIAARQTRRAAAVDRWYLWIASAVGIVLATYFYTHPEIWTMRAEGFYVLIFGTMAFLAFVAGLYTIYRRPDLPVLPGEHVEDASP